ncbi:MAG: adenylate/guanylate cyclase domain-containing protein [Sandaracinaceae bacterium]
MSAPRRYEVTLERVIDAPRELVWAVVSDTNRSDRAIGLAAATYRWDKDADGNQVRVASASELGVALEWVEPPYRWIEGSFVQGARTFVKGPVHTGYFEARLSDTEDGKTLLRAKAGMTAEGPLAVLLGPVQKLKFRSGLQRYLGGVVSALDGWRDVPTGGRDQPAAVRVKTLLSRAYDPVTSGPRSEANRSLLDRRGQQLIARGVSADAAERLLRHIAEAADDEVAQMRPFELAHRWGLPRRDVLSVFLHATVAGITDLRWQVNCPVCRVGAAVVEGLDAVDIKTHCQACQIHFDADFAQHIEAVFPTNQAVRPVETMLYCASSPAFLPHVYAQLEVPAGETMAEEADLPHGSLHARVLGRPGGADRDRDDDAPIRIEVDDDGVRFATPEAGDPALTIVNRSATAATVLLERAGWHADSVLGTVIGSFPEFVDLFATEAPRSGVDLTVSHLALLFSDLVGSTALYERVGDARAFAVVEDHFRLMTEAIRDHGGAIIKTMGDAVMAAFTSDAEAVAAARAMIERHDAAHPDDGLGVKIGVYGGPCLAVRANDRLDYFGTTVNLAARLQAQAKASEIVVSRAAADDPSVAKLLERFPRREFDAALKGIESEQALVGVTITRA